MFLGRMAYRLSLLYLAIWTTLPAVAATATTNISAEILDFVPPCAQSCFQSFISANFDSDICGDSPSLQCLCRQEGASGYTIGEGAVSCVVGESSIGACRRSNTNGDITATAYNMCVGVSEAASRTHSTIVATLVVPPSGTGALLVPAATGTRTGTGRSTGTATATVTTTPTPTATVSTGATGLPATTAPTCTTSPASMPTATPASSGGPSPLSSAQIAGITLGCAAVVVFGILLVLLARCVRRRRFGDVEAGFSKMRDSMSFGRGNRPNSAPGPQISGPLAQIPAERDPADPRWKQNLPISPSGARVGTAARPSPAPGAAQASAPASGPSTAPVTAPSAPPAPMAAVGSVPKLVLIPPPDSDPPTAKRSPPKPTLTLAIPKGAAEAARIPANARDSVVTEFAEDGEGEAGQRTSIWRPPPTDPQSATTYYFADKGGNWILRNDSTRKMEAETRGGAIESTRPAIYEAPSAAVEVELPSPEHKTRAERAKDAYGGFSPDAVVSPLRLASKPGQVKLGSPIAFKQQRPERKPSSPSSSARSPPAKTRTPDTYFAMIREGRDLTGGKSRRRSSVRRASRRVSQDSATSIEWAAAAPFEDEDMIEDEPQADLSPVAESPHTPISPGKSPVTYPKIRGRNGGQQATAARDRAPEPDLLPSAHRYNMWYPAGHDSPTGASVLPKTRTVTSPAPPPSKAPKKAWNAPNLGPAPNQNPGRMRTGSPETRPGPGNPLEQRYWQRQRQVANPASYWNQPQPAQQGRPPTRMRPTPPTPPYELPGENIPSRRRRNDPAPVPAQAQAHAPTAQAGPPTRPAALPTPQTTPQQPGSTSTTSSGNTSSQSSSSSLLAKRRGADKAAALALVGPGNGGGGGGVARRKGKPGWTKEEAAVPITPGWVPELTPTRRGQDLVLKVR